MMYQNNIQLKNKILLFTLLFNFQYLLIAQQKYSINEISKQVFLKLSRNNNHFTFFDTLNMEIENFIRSIDWVNHHFQNNIDSLILISKSNDSVIIKSTKDIAGSNLICNYKKLSNNNYLIIMFSYEIYYYLYINIEIGKIDTLCSYPYFAKNGKLYADNCTMCGEYEPHSNCIDIYELTGNKIHIENNTDCVISMSWTDDNSLLLKTLKNKKYHYYLIKLYSN